MCCACRQSDDGGDSVSQCTCRARTSAIELNRCNRAERQVAWSSHWNHLNTTESLGIMQLPSRFVLPSFCHAQGWTFRRLCYRWAGCTYSHSTLPQPRFPARPLQGIPSRLYSTAVNRPRMQTSARRTIDPSSPTQLH